MTESENGEYTEAITFSKGPTSYLMLSKRGQ